jgi:hypothetical protein
MSLQTICKFSVGVTGPARATGGGSTTLDGEKVLTFGRAEARDMENSSDLGVHFGNRIRAAAPSPGTGAGADDGGASGRRPDDETDRSTMTAFDASGVTIAGPGATVGRRFATRVAVALAFLSVLLMMTVSAAMLTRIGIPYVSSGGSLVTKIHPATWVAALAVLPLVIARGGMVRFVVGTAVGRPGLAALACGAGLILLHVVLVSRLPLAPIIDTFVLPILLVVLLEAADRRDLDRLARVLMVIFAVNAALGCLEYASGWRLTPMYDGEGRPIAYDWRASALFGHPLANAFLDGTWLVALAAGALPGLPRWTRLAAMGLAAVALVAFGGRVSMVSAVALTAAIGGLAGLRILAGARFRLATAVTAVLAATVAALFLVVFLDMGGADRFIERFSSDHGSAQARVAMFGIFENLTLDQFLMWPDPALIAQAQREFGIRIGVESSQVAFVAFYGLAVTLVFLAAIGLFLHELVRATTPRTWWLVAHFVVVMSSSNGIAAKSLSLAQFAVIVLAFMPPRPSARRAGPAPSASLAEPRR